MPPMRYGTSAGSLLLDDDRLLLVHHYQHGKFDLWMPPGGSLVGSVNFSSCAHFLKGSSPCGMAIQGRVSGSMPGSSPRSR
jgi:hypothetical protein